jgi:hypothetical protein
MQKLLLIKNKELNHHINSLKEYENLLRSFEESKDSILQSLELDTSSKQDSYLDLLTMVTHQAESVQT